MTRSTRIQRHLLTLLSLLALCLLAVPVAQAQNPALHPAIQNVIRYSTDACQWSPPIKESSGIVYECPGGTVMTGMKHSGDENGDTEYLCCALTPQPVQKTSCAWSNPIKEANSIYYCPGWKAMTGRVHWGDENGDTKYECCDLANPVGSMWPDDTTCSWSPPQKQPSSNLECNGGTVMRGRSHQGDENGDTQIYCCSFFGNG